MNTVFGNLLQKAVTDKKYDSSTIEARDWLRDKASSMRGVDPSRVLQSSPTTSRKNAVSIGRMFLFAYDAKHKDTLPYYDRYPLIFPFKKMQDGFLGINMHYLPPIFRARLMDSLYDTINNPTMDDTTKLRINYDILNSAAKFRYFKPCIKHYLNSQIDSRLIIVDPKEWDFALFLPLQRFKGATTATVYKDSRAIINKGR
jgi:hypothetical protein